MTIPYWLLISKRQLKQVPRDFIYHNLSRNMDVIQDIND